MRAQGKALKAAAQLVNFPMSYLALARKWRPRTFSQLVGQDHINKALIKSLNQQRLHHAYLFTGTRGVGKTSIARLMAKALNCEKGVSSEPCLQCEACVAIEQGRFIDLIEIDGASKTRVEDTRELMENVQYAPTNGRYKIYLIDEVHMLSQHSFNALLKTLEEPPEHVKFLLATTDPQKLPVTILSRCLQFTLKHLSPDIISNHLAGILKQEQYPYEDEALPLLAKAAHGSMRDALSLLDQAIASSENILNAKDVKDILGYTQQDFAIQILQALAAFEAPALISLSRQIAAEGGQFSYVLDEVLEYLHQITICQNLPDSAMFLSASNEIIELAKQLTTQNAQLFYQIGIKSIEEMHLAPSLLIGFEMMLLRMFTFQPATTMPLPTLIYETLEEKHIPKASQSNSEQIQFVQALTSVLVPEKKAVPVQKDEPSLSLEPVSSIDKIVDATSDESWETILKQIKLTGLAQNAAENAEMIRKRGSEIILHVAKGHQSLFTPNIILRIEQALTAYFRETIKINLDFNESVQSTPAQKKHIAQNLNQQEAEESLQEDLFLQQLKQEFSAEPVKNSVEPL